MIVLDASVILKWIFPDEPDRVKSLQYKEAHVKGVEIVAVPDLLFYEIANVLTTKTTIETREISEVFSLIWQLELEVFSFALEEFSNGINLSRKFKITFYDSAYIELARALKCSFVTADKKLYEKVKSLHAVRVHLL
jgi:predicted nucleic acid-binding protein